MNVTAIKTEIVREKGDLLKFLDRYLQNIPEGSVLAITSKIVSLCENRVVEFLKNKEDLIAQEADWYLPSSSSKYNVCLAIKDNSLTASAGIDESNSRDGYVLLPENSQATANQVREYLSLKHKLKNFGVIITDSRTSPLQWGVTGMALAYSGFKPLKDYIGTPDLFDRNFHYSKASIVNSLAAAATLVMGEGRECQPLALLSDLPFVTFESRNPTEEELQNLLIDPADDLYAPLLTSVKWEKGKGGKDDK